MNRSRLLMIGGLALAVGLLVAFTVYNRLRTFAASSNNAGGVPVVVAADDIQVGAKVQAQDVPVVTIPPVGGSSRGILRHLEGPGPRCSYAGKQGRIYSAQQAGGAKRRSRPALADPAGNARGFSACQRCGFGGGLCATGHARGCAGYGYSRQRQRTSNHHRPRKRCSHRRGQDPGPEFSQMRKPPR